MTTTNIGEDAANGATLPAWFDTFIRNVCELPDRNSPEDEPEAIVATPEELKQCALNAIEQCGAANGASGEREAEVELCRHCGEPTDAPGYCVCNGARYEREHRAALTAEKVAAEPVAPVDLSPENWTAVFHTAFRHAGDSRFASDAHNAIELMDNKEWRDIVEYVLIAIKRATNTTKSDKPVDASQNLSVPYPSDEMLRLFGWESHDGGGIPRAQAISRYNCAASWVLDAALTAAQSASGAGHD
jgi:hypothetical protein